MFKGVSWIAVLVAFVLVYGLGFLWYGVVFEEAWIAALGREPDMTNANVLMALGALNTLVIVVGLAWLLGRLGATRLASGLGASLAAFVFFAFTAMAMDFIYQGDSIELFTIDVGYQLLSYLAAGAVLALIRPRPAAAPASA